MGEVSRRQLLAFALPMLPALMAAKTNGNTGINELRMEIARRLRKQRLIRKVSLDPADPARIILIARNPKIKQIEVDVTNLSGRLRGLPPKGYEAEIQRFIRLILKWAASSSPSGN